MSRPVEDGETVEWVVTWFPPNRARSRRVFTNEQAAFACLDERHVAEWNPMFEKRTITVVSETLPLPTRR